MNRRLYCFIAVLAMLASFLVASGAAAERLLPLRVGSIFIYECSDNAGNTWQWTNLVSGKARAGGHRYIVVDFYTAGEWEADCRPIRSTRNKAYYYLGLGTEYIFVQDAPIGTSWTYTNLAGETIEYILEATETVAVPAGIFEDCLRVVWRTVSCDPPTLEGRMWFQPGFWLVKYIDYHSPNWPVVSELVSWEGPLEEEQNEED